MKRIFKYPLAITDEQRISMPVGAEILCVQMQADTMTIWARVDDAAPVERRLIRVFGTGHDASESVDLSYVGTVQERWFVWHVFEGGAS